MSAPISALTVAPLNAGVAPKAKANTAENAARQFEGLMLTQMLRQARQSAKLDGDGDTDSDGSDGSTMMDLADQQFAQMMANHGGIGLSKMMAGALKSASKSKEESPEKP